MDIRRHWKYQINPLEQYNISSSGYQKISSKSASQNKRWPYILGIYNIPKVWGKTELAEHPVKQVSEDITTIR